MCSQIYPDPQAEKAIMASVVYCIHHKEGCAWAGELRKLKVSTPSWTCVTFCHSLFACFSFNSRKQVYFFYIYTREGLLNLLEPVLKVSLSSLSWVRRRRQVCAHLLIAHPCESNPLKTTRAQEIQNLLISVKRDFTFLYLALNEFSDIDATLFVKMKRFGVVNFSRT